MLTTIKITTVHPNVTRAESDGQTIELPTNAFPVRPVEGQVWRLSLERQRSDDDRIADLNHLIGAA